MAAGLAIIPVACGTDSSGDGSADNSSGTLSAAFAENCASCHGERGEGTAQGRSLTGYEGGADSFRNQVRSGGDGMPAFDSATYSESDLLTDYTWLISNVELEKSRP